MAILVVNNCGASNAAQSERYRSAQIPVYKGEDSNKDMYWRSRATS